jgi:hypothetical protein
MDIDDVMKKHGGICLYCNKRIAVLCGTPLIIIGGCCYGKTIGKTQYIFPRKAHLECWLKHNKLKIVKEKP